MKKIFNLLWLVLLFSCETEEPQIISPIDSVIKVETKEVTAGNQKKVILACRTEKIFNCSNYIIKTERQAGSNTFEFVFLGTGIGGICFTALGPARADLYLGTLENGTYTVKLNESSFANTGTLTVTNTEILLNFPQPNGILILNPVYKR